MTIFANERDSENMSVGTSEPDRERQAVERPIPGDADFKCKSGSLELNRLEGGDVLVVSKLHPGFDDECVDDLTRLLSAISSGRTARPKYLVFDFAHRRGGEASGSADSRIWSPRTRSLSSRLQLSPSPGSALSWRAPISNSRVIARCWWPKGRPFSRSTETPTNCSGSMRRWRAKLVWSKLKGSMETGAVLGAEDMHNLMLAKDVVEPRRGLAAIGDYMRQCGTPLQRRLRHFSRAEVGHEHDRLSRGRADPRLKRSRNAAFRRRSCF